MLARIDRKRTILISSVNRAADPTQGGDCLGRRMAVSIAFAHANYRYSRREGLHKVQILVARTMMSDFVHIKLAELLNLL